MRGTRAAVWLVVLTVVGWAGCIDPLDTGSPQVDAANGPAGFSSTAVFPGEYAFDEAHSLVLRKGPFDLLPGEAEKLASDLDGVDIQVGVVRPDVPEGTAVPIIVLASPYHAPLHAIDLHQRQPRLTENFVRHGYAVAYVAVRGTADSGGCMDLMGAAERADLDQAVTWLGTRPWSNGNVGMIGVSYDGSTPWEVAATGNPHLRTVVPISGLSDLFDLGFRNGSAEGRMLGLMGAGYYLDGFLLTNPTHGRSAENSVSGALCPESWKGLGAALASAATGERDPTGFWAERNSRPGVEANYEGSIFLVHGLQDWNVDPHHAYPWVNELEHRGLVVKHLLGQWGHAWPDGAYLGDDLRRYDFAEVLLRWFDRWLKGDEAVDLGPRVQVQDSALRWRSEDAWPPNDAAAVRFHLTPRDALATEPEEGYGTRVLGPSGGLLYSEETNDELLCAGCAAFRTEPFESEFRFAGLPQAHLTVLPAGPGGHVAAFLYAEKNDEWTRLGWGQMDLRFAGGGETAEPVVPGQPLIAKLELQPLDAVVPEGSRLTLVVSMGTTYDRVPSPTPAPVTLIVGDERSTLTVLAFERGTEPFFEPPRP